MKDLYRRIGLSARTDDVAEIERAIATTVTKDPKSARAARHVLLDTDRKRFYDQTRSVLSQVGQLRANLGLSRAPNWLATDCSEFDCAPSIATSKIQAGRKRNKQARRDRFGLNTRGQIGIVIGAIVLCAAVVGSLFDGKLSSSHKASASEARNQTGYVPAEKASKNDVLPLSAIEPQYSTTTSMPLPSVDPRLDRLRELVTKRLERSGVVSSAADIEIAVQKLISGSADALPATGVMSKSFSTSGVAPLEIKTTAGTNYFVKILDWNTKTEIMTAFIRGGVPFETKLPVGTYELRYASGHDWYGAALDFGEGAVYARCDDIFEFNKTDRGYSGYTVELILQDNGNLQTDPISQDEF